MTFIRPQRLICPSPPGSLLKRSETAPVARKAPNSDQDAGYLALVQCCPCLRCGMEPTEAAHVRYASAAFGKSSGMQKKPPDRFAVPLCADCHRLARDAQHRQNERAFWEAIDINPLIVATNLYAKRGDLIAMRAVCFVAIAERIR
jgi:hypothetical protein